MTPVRLESRKYSDKIDGPRVTESTIVLKQEVD